MTKKKTQVKVNENVPVRNTDLITRTMVDEEHCSCGGCIWIVNYPNGKQKKCGDCGYIFSDCGNSLW